MQALTHSHPLSTHHLGNRSQASRPAGSVSRCLLKQKRRSVVITSAKGGSNDDNDGEQVTRRFLLTAAGISVGFPLIKTIVGDLGYGIADEDNQPATLPDPGTKYAVATFAGGCFWCMEAPFDKIPGVLATTSGYTGGSRQNPLYLQVSAGVTGHAESVQVMYDPAVTSYETLLDVYWHQVDPTSVDRQFVDVGPQYRTAIFYHNEEQRLAAEASKARLEDSGVFGKGLRIVTQIVPATKFWPAENYHQDYYQRNTGRYSVYRALSGRDAYIAAVWGDTAVSSH